MTTRALRYEWFDTAAACANSAAIVFAAQGWKWHGSSVPTREMIFRELIMLSEHGNKLEPIETGRLIYERGRFGHQRTFDKPSTESTECNPRRAAEHAPSESCPNCNKQAVEIERLQGVVGKQIHTAIAKEEEIERLKGELRYWREAVKNASEGSDTGPSSGMCYTCNFCNENDGEASSVSGDGIIAHKPDCPWTLAQLEQ